MKNVLVVRGAVTADELKSFGLPMAQRFAEADTVIGIDPAGNARAIKTREQLEVSFVDGDSALSEFASIVEEIKQRYEAQADPKDRHLAHAIVGLWFFWWMGRGEDISPLPVTMAGASDIEQLRASARAFIKADFGRNLAEPDKLPSDGGTDTTGA